MAHPCKEVGNSQHLVTESPCQRWKKHLAAHWIAVLAEHSCAKKSTKNGSVKTSSAIQPESQIDLQLFYIAKRKKLMWIVVAII